MRWAFKTRDASPFACETCGDRDREARNCYNALDLSNDALAVSDYTDEVKAALSERNAKKVFTLGDMRLYECPLSYLSEDTRDIIQMVFLMDSTKRLLFSGEWGDQPAWLVEAYGIFLSESAAYIKEERD
ncbi:MAG: hypothetical protein HZB85_01865 [Deltaproteobacteria bacterium]|nr:hypothetical protein [Deltaproteobacteria bacterium]